MLNFSFFENLRKNNHIALEEVANVLREEIVKVTPRDPNRPPQDPNKPVTGTLKRSIISKNTWNSAYAGVSASGNQVPYARTQEYGNSKVRPRSYIRLTKDNSEVQKKLFTTYQNVLKKLW